MQNDLHSFNKTILCRRACDRCRKVIRFFGVRCKDCRFKCHRKCSNCITTECRQNQEFQAKHITCRVGKFWQKQSKDRRKCALGSRFNSLPSRRAASPEEFNRSLQPRKYVDAKGKIRQKLINGLYESFCYSPRHAIDLHPKNGSNSSPPPQTANVTVHREQTLRQTQSSFRGDRLVFDVDLIGSENNRRTSQEQLLPCPQTWKRTNSWSSRHSAMTSFTSSSGYSSMPASCPSSANSHRSTSPTPDFSNIRSLTATLERCSLEEDIDLQERVEFREGFWDKSLPIYAVPATWPLSRKTRPSQNDTRRIFSVDDCQTSSEREESTVKSNPSSSAQSDQESEDDMKKSLREWRIPFTDLQFGDVVGASPKGHVYKGRWHGDIMIHTVKKTARADFEEFLKEVSLLSMIRHENVVLFMGACLEPPNLAFITSVRKGLSLHTHLHVRHDFFPLSTRISIARQIAQGMSYLHAKGIVLPHLNSMNVLLESKVKLCVTAYSGRTAIERHGYVSIPRGHLTYIPPEMMRTLTWCDDDVIPFEIHSIKSNIYAYGTILYEIMTGRWPFSLHPVESIIWMVGKGTKQCLRHTKCPENIKSLLRQCWSDDIKERPEFSKVVQFFQEQNFPPESSHKRINGSYSEPEKMHLVGRTGRLSIR